MKQINRNNVYDILPLTALQTSLLISYIVKPEGNHYKEITRYKITGDISLENLKDAIKYIVDNNEMLRTVYRFENISHPVQIILKKKVVPIIEYDLVNKVDSNIVIDELEENNFNEKLDITENPIKFIIYKINVEQYYLSVINHHILFDGWSNAILLRELYNTLLALSSKKPIIQTEKSSFKKYIEYINKQDKNKQLKFWKEYLDGIRSKIKLPLINENSNCEKREKLHLYKADESIYCQVKELSSHLGVSYAAVFYGIWGLLYHKYNKEKDITFGIAFDGRPSEIQNINNTMGLFMNSIPLRIPINTRGTTNTYIKQVNSILMNVREYQYTPYNEIIAQSEAILRGDLYDSVIVIQNYPVDINLLRESNKIKISLHSRKISTGVKLTIEIRTFGGFFIDVSYQDGYYNEFTIQNMINEYLALLKKLIANDDKLLTVYDLIFDKEKNSKGKVMRSSTQALNIIKRSDFNDVF